MIPRILCRRYAHTWPGHPSPVAPCAPSLSSSTFLIFPLTTAPDTAMTSLPSRARPHMGNVGITAAVPRHRVIRDCGRLITCQCLTSVYSNKYSTCRELPCANMNCSSTVQFCYITNTGPPGCRNPILPLTDSPCLVHALHQLASQADCINISIDDSPTEGPGSFLAFSSLAAYGRSSFFYQHPIRYLRQVLQPFEPLPLQFECGGAVIHSVIRIGRRSCLRKLSAISKSNPFTSFHCKIIFLPFHSGGGAQSVCLVMVFRRCYTACAQQL
ncbi:hypothetical protein AcV7_010412 [Taiwanofungus camphoratus]|nr:hypothetical protein AcV7_010412 [Antrodia cinnamomea]